MNEYELADYTSSVMGNFLTCITVYFSIVTAYVVAAFAAGARLSRVQLVIVNITFTIAATVIGTLSYLIYVRFYELAVLSQQVLETIIFDFGPPLAILILILYLGSHESPRFHRRLISSDQAALADRCCS